MTHSYKKGDPKSGSHAKKIDIYICNTNTKPIRYAGQKEISQHAMILSDYCRCG